MQKLKKIIEELDAEIEKERAICKDIENTSGWRLYEMSMQRAKDIIQKHIEEENDREKL